MTTPNRYYLAALCCGLVPLATGIGIYLLWLQVGWTWLFLAGWFVLFFGIVSTIIGTGLLIAFAATSMQAEPTRRIGLRLRLPWPLSANFPTALTIVFLADSVHLTVVNNGPEIEQLILTQGNGCAEVDLGAIRTGQRRFGRIHVACDGSLDFTARRGGQIVRAQLTAYAISPCRMVLTFLPDGEWRVEELDRD